MKFRHFVGMFLLMSLVFSVAGCGCTNVGQGEIGRIKTKSGWQNKLLMPAEHWVPVRGQMYLLDATEDTYRVKMDILTADDINLSCAIEMRCGVDVEREEEVLGVFDRVRVDPVSGMITREAIYQIYGKMLHESLPREVLGPLTITTIREQREQLGNQIDKRIREEMATTPIKVFAVKITNIDWPKVITDAMERRKEMEIAVEEKRAEIEKAVVDAQGQHRVAEEQYKVQILEAKMIADANLIIASSLKDNPEFLAWHRVKFLSQAAAGPNNAFILFPYDTMQSEGGKQMVSNVQLRQLLDSKISPEAKAIMEDMENKATKKVGEQPKPPETPKAE